VAVCCEDGDESSLSVKCAGFLDQLMNCELLNKDSARRICLLICVVSYSNLNKQNIGTKYTPLSVFAGTLLLMSGLYRQW